METLNKKNLTEIAQNQIAGNPLDLRKTLAMLNQIINLIEKEDSENAIAAEAIFFGNEFVDKDGWPIQPAELGDEPPK